MATELATSPDPAPSHFLVVGIGASAGAIGALSRLLEGIPADPDMAFVVVVHLSSEHVSHLAEILAKCTTRIVQPVVESIPIERNRVYVASPGLQLRVDAGHLHVSRVDRHAVASTAIDIFLRTLGDAYRERAIGMVLSGMGAEGGLGLRRIKELGGVTFAQSPDEAEYASMPTSAIAAGAVDFVLKVAEIGPRLIELQANARRMQLPDEAELSLRTVRPATQSSAAQSERALLEIMNLLRERTGHDFEHYKPATVLRRLERRLQVTNVPSLPEYSRYLLKHFDETAALVKDLLISVTNFFRDADAFAALESAIDTFVLGTDPEPDRVRAWVTGCATGEEAYSLGIVLIEQASRRARTPDISIFASDIDDGAIAFARAGLYPESIAADVPHARLRHFEREQCHLRVSKELRETVLFASHNLMRDPPFSNLDIVCCRNLLIYLDRQVQAQVLQILHFALRPGGLLFLGGAESADLAEGLFTTVDKEHRIYRAATVPRSLRHQMPALSGNTGLDLPAAMAKGIAGPVGSPAALHEQLCFAHAPASVLIDGADNVLHSTPRTATFLRFASGMPTQNLVDMVRPELAPELRTALVRAWAERKIVEARRVRVRLQGLMMWVAMNVRPVDHEGTRYILVTFHEVEPASDPGAGQRGSDNPTVAMLEEELEHTREELRGSLEQTVVSTEELCSSNKELQSINEEMRSTTEELETSKEELQSVNEELITVNQELKVKIDEASMVNDDLMNLVSSTDIATILVDRAMLIKRFTPRAAQLFNLIPNDQGRSLLHITHRLDYALLEADVLEAFDTLRVVEREVYGRSGATFLVRVLPYRTRQDVVDGAVLTFIDISAIRRAEEKVRVGEANLRLLVESTKDFAIVTLDPSGAVTTWNLGARRMFGYEAEEIVGQPIDLIFMPHDRSAGVPQRVMRIAREEGRATDERWQLRKDGSTFFCSGIMTPMSEHSQLVGYAKIARDLTDSKRAEIQLAALLEQETEVRAELQRAITMKDEFLAVMSHELKHPLNLIHVNAELLARLPEARDIETVTRAADVIRRAVLSQAKIIDDLLDLSRLRTGKLTIHATPVLWASTLTKVADAVADDAAAKNLTLLVDLGPANLAVMADAVRVEQIVWNLVSNALKFTPSGGRIELLLSRDNVEGRLDVIDNGQGIAADFIEEIFDMFRQADRSITRAQGGMGIGLALVKHLVEEQGGHVEVVSEGIGHGARFSVWLPLAGTGGAELTAGEPLVALAGLRLLVVDDTADALESFAALLQLEGAHVTAVTSAGYALAALDSASFDLILSDVAMPGMDGYEFVTRVRAEPRTAALPAIALTGFGRSQDVQRALEAGFDAHLTKPIVLDQLIATLRDLPGFRGLASRIV